MDGASDIRRLGPDGRLDFLTGCTLGARVHREQYRAGDEYRPPSHSLLFTADFQFGKRLPVRCYGRCLHLRLAPTKADQRPTGGWLQLTLGAALNSGFFLGGGMLNSTFAMASPAKKAEISFETAMERLEKIVEEMESGKMLLEDLLVRYEEGMKLVKVCQERLAHAEQKIQIITRDHGGKTSVKDFAATEPPIASAVADSMKENDDVRLF